MLSSVGPAGRRLAVLLGSVLLLLGLVFGGVTLQDHEATLQDGWTLAEQAATGAGEHADRSLAAARLVADRIADNVRRSGPGIYAGIGHADFIATLRHAPQIDALWLADERGRLVANSLSPDPLPLDLSTRPYFARLRDGARSDLTAMLWGPVNNGWFFSYNRAVRDRDGSFLGIVQAAMHAAEFQRVQRALGLGQRGRIGLFRASDGAPLMLHPLPPPPTTQNDPPDAPFAPPIAARNVAAAGLARSGRYEIAQPDGEVLLVAWHLAGEAGAILASAALPRSTALRPFQRRLTRNASLFGFALLVVIGLGWLVARAVAQSVELGRRAEDGQRDLSTVLEATGEGVFVLDRLWRIRFLNTRAAAALTTGADPTGLVLWDAVPDLSNGAVRQAFEDTMQHRERAVAEVEAVEPARRFRAESHPREDGGLTIFLRDITEEHAASAKLAESEARLRRLLDNLFVFVCVLSPDGTLLEANRAPLEAAGLTLADVRGLPFWETHWWAHDAAIQARLREACARAAAGTPSRYDVEVRLAGDSRMTIDFQIAPLFDAAGRITHLIPSATDITGRSRAEKALAESEGRLRLAQEAAEVGVFERVLPGEHAHWSASMFRLYGLDPEGRSPWVTTAEHIALLHPADRAMHAERRRAMREDPSIVRFADEFRINRADTGETLWIASRGEVVRDAAGKAVLVRGITQDITDRRRAEERQLLLAREVDHRAKNALAVVQAIVGLTRDADPAQFRAAVAGRIAAMARAHNLLAREGWDSAELRDLIEEEMAPHRAAAAGGADRVTVQGPPVALAAGAAQPLAMALHELATNAVKYGALSVPGGTVAIGWEQVADGELRLAWIERGGPPLAGAPARRGFGSSVIRNTVERQLGGAVSFDWPKAGLECRLNLPNRQLIWAAAERLPAGP